MISIGIAIAAGIFTGLLVAWPLGLVASILPALAVAVLSYFLLARQIAKQIEQAMKKTMFELQRGKMEQAIRSLQELQRRYGWWQLFLKSSLDGQIGSVFYMQREFEKAKPYLQKAFIKHWVAKAMLGVIYFQKKEFKKMDQTFEEAVRYSSKQGLLWSLWAYCHYKASHQERALEILGKGKQKLQGSDPHLEANLIHLQNQKKMKMRAYGEQWYQFLLEVPPQMRQAQSRQVRFVHR